MARITVEDCLEVVNNRFELVMMASKRARQLANGVQATLDNSETEDKPTVLALREIAARKIDNALIDEVEKAERERAEREALEWGRRSGRRRRHVQERRLTASINVVAGSPNSPPRAGCFAFRICRKRRAGIGFGHEPRPHCQGRRSPRCRRTRLRPPA